MTDPFVILTSSRSPEPQSNRPHLWSLIVAVLVLLVTAILVLGPGTQMTPLPAPSDTVVREARTYTVSYRFGVYSPTNLRIHVGDTVRFRNDGSLPIRITADPVPGTTLPEFDSVGSVTAGNVFSYVFANAGTFSYHTVGKVNETGTIIVR
ncbi:MAG TPA: hypothetical protein VMU12_02630 [Candidatus Paceibacterota bacterium]|nr:hypothetical protein [Candidatus Paceibacterota bacterium]